MDALIGILIWILICACVVWLLKYALDSFKAPTPAYWICLIVILIFLLATISGHGGPALYPFHL